MVCKGVSGLFITGQSIEVDISTAEIKNLDTGETITGEKLDEQARSILDAGGYISFTKKRLGL